MTLHNARTTQELKTIIEKCNETFGFNITEKNREEKYAFARMCFFYFARNFTDHTLSEIGDLCNLHHATVIHGIKKYESLIIYEDFKKISDKVKFQFEIPYFDLDSEKNSVEKQLRETEKLLDFYKNKCEDIECKLSTARKRIGNKQLETDILDMFETLTTDKLMEFVEYRLKPFIKMTNK